MKEPCPAIRLASLCDFFYSVRARVVKQNLTRAVFPKGRIGVFPNPAQLEPNKTPKLHHLPNPHH